MKFVKKPKLNSLKWKIGIFSYSFGKGRKVWDFSVLTQLWCVWIFLYECSFKREKRVKKEIMRLRMNI